jgi:hypothetical protein
MNEKIKETQEVIANHVDNPRAAISVAVRECLRVVLSNQIEIMKALQQLKLK